MNRKTLTILFVSMLLCACHGGTQFNAEGGILELASHITINETPHSYHVRIANPWKKGTLLHTYTFTDSLPTDYSFNRNVNTVHIPLKRVVVMTNSLAHLMVELGVEDCKVSFFIYHQGLSFSVVTILVHGSHMKRYIVV